VRDKLIEQVLRTVRNYEMLSPGDHVLVALSGGPDSVFLLRAMHDLKNKFKLSGITVCNLDHGLRGKESVEDSRFAKAIANKLGLRFIHKKIRLKKSAKLSTEEMAREARYKFYREACRKSGANIVATGHTLDDQAETVIMRIIKGASLKGAVGILPVRREGDISYIRPMIELEKPEILKYLSDNSVDYRIDRTNLENIYFRNVVRSEILPFLKNYNPRIKRALFSFAEHLREDFEFIENEKARAKDLITGVRDGTVEIALKDIAIQPGALQKEILRDALKKAGGEVKRLSFRHWKDLSNFIKYKRTGSSIDLPGSIRVSRTASSVRFFPIPK
jgi:tRNA(Ile)-lysidine synthase